MRRHRLTSVDKSNVLETSRLWRQVTIRVMAADIYSAIPPHTIAMKPIGTSDFCQMRRLAMRRFTAVSISWRGFSG